MKNEVKEVKVQNKLSAAAYAYITVPVAPASELLAQLLKKAE